MAEIAGPRRIGGGMGYSPTGVQLDGPPPSPAMPAAPGLLAGSELGAQAGNPQIAVLRGMQAMEMAAQDIVKGLPNLAPQLAELIANLRQAVPQEMARLNGGGMGDAGTGMPVAGPPPGL